MANSSVNIITRPVGAEGRTFNLPVDGGTHIYENTLVSQLTATGMIVPGSTADSGKAVGIAMHEQDNSAGSDGDKRVFVESDRIFLFANGATTDACSEATLLNAPVFMADDHTVYDNDASGTLQCAGFFKGMEPDGKVRVLVTSSSMQVAADSGALTDSSGGTANGTIQAIGSTYDQAEVANNFADLAAKYNALRTALRSAGIMA